MGLYLHDVSFWGFSAQNWKLPPFLKRRPKRKYSLSAQTDPLNGSLILDHVIL